MTSADSTSICLLQEKVSHCYPHQHWCSGMVYTSPGQMLCHTVPPALICYYCNEPVHSCSSAGGANTFLFLTEVTSCQSPPFPNTTILSVSPSAQLQVQASVSDLILQQLEWITQLLHEHTSLQAKPPPPPDEGNPISLRKG